MIAVLGFVVMTALTRDPRQDIRLDELGPTDVVPGLSDMQRDTAGICRDIPGCIQGAHSSDADFLRFDSRENAAAFASKAGDAHHSNWIVIAYHDTAMSQDDREFLQYYIDSLGNSD